MDDSKLPRRRDKRLDFELGPIAKAIGMSWATLPPSLIDFIARDKALYREVHDIYKSDHLDHLRNGDPPRLRDSGSYKWWARILAQPRYLREADWGVLILANESREKQGESIRKIRITCYLDALVENPCLNDEGPELDFQLTSALSRLKRRYRGPGLISFIEGYEYSEGTVLEVTGEPNKVLDVDLVAQGLSGIFHDRKFDTIVKAITENAKGAHRHYRSN